MIIFGKKITSGIVIRLGAIAAALVSLGSLVAYAAPAVGKIIDSGPLPLAGQVQLAQLGKQLQELQQANQRMLEHQDQSDRNQDYTTLGLLEMRLEQAQKDAAAHPSLTTQRALHALEDQINVVRHRVGLPSK